MIRDGRRKILNLDKPPSSWYLKLCLRSPWSHWSQHASIYQAKTLVLVEVETVRAKHVPKEEQRSRGTQKHTPTPVTSTTDSQTHQSHWSSYLGNHKALNTVEFECKQHLKSIQASVSLMSSREDVASARVEGGNSVQSMLIPHNNMHNNSDACFPRPFFFPFYLSL